MDLEAGRKRRVRHHRRDGAAAVFLDGRALVVGAEPHVQPAMHAARNTAASAEETMGDIGERAGAKDVNRAHNWRRMIRSRSIWPPVLNA